MQSEFPKFLEPGILNTRILNMSEAYALTDSPASEADAWPARWQWAPRAGPLGRRGPDSEQSGRFRRFDLEKRGPPCRAVQSRGPVRLCPLLSKPLCWGEGSITKNRSVDKRPFTGRAQFRLLFVELCVTCIPFGAAQVRA